MVALGPTGLWLLALLDSLGVPLPGGVDALLIYLSAKSPSGAYWLAFLASVGSVGGNIILFLIARKGGQIYLDKHTLSSRGKRFRQWFQHYGLLTVFVPGLIPIPMPMKIFVLCSGALGVRLTSFILVVTASRLPRFFGLAYLGAHLGDQGADYLKQHVWHLVVIALLVFLVLFVAVKIMDRVRQREAAQLTQTTE